MRSPLGAPREPTRPPPPEPMAEARPRRRQHDPAHRPVRGRRDPFRRRQHPAGDRPRRRTAERLRGHRDRRRGPAAAGGPLSAANAAALREVFEVLRPRLVGESTTSVGTGDRLGLATAGQARAFREQGQGTVPVLAQQSIREMDRLSREARSVIDDATFGCVEEGWDGGYGADCDHIKTTEGIDRGLAAGFVTFTLDPGDAVVDVTAGVTAEQLEAVPWEALGDDLASVHARYVGTTLDLGERKIEITQDDIDTAVVKYGAAVAETVRLYQHLISSARHEVEVEIAVDETAWITTFVEHYVMARELERLGVEWFSFAPRYVDGFEKGLDFLGEDR